MVQMRCAGRCGRAARVALACLREKGWNSLFAKVSGHPGHAKLEEDLAVDVCVRRLEGNIDENLSRDGRTGGEGARERAERDADAVRSAQQPVAGHGA